MSHLAALREGQIHFMIVQPDWHRRLMVQRTA
jgi:hypothetical protein